MKLDPNSTSSRDQLPTTGKLSKFDVSQIFSTTIDSIVYNVTVNDYETDTEPSTPLKDLISKLTSSGSVSSTTVPSNLENDAYLSIRNVSSLSCLHQHIPSVHQYLAAINLVGVTIFTLGALAVCVILYLYIDTLKHVMKYAPPLAKTHSAFVLSVYPVVAVATYCAIVVPRAHLLAEAMTQGMFMACLYQLFCLFVAYCGGEAELIKRVKPDSLVLRVPPCCCWPCCFCLPLLPVNKTNMKRLRLLVLQLPVVQGLVYMVLLVMWAEEEVSKWYTGAVFYELFTRIVAGKNFFYIFMHFLVFAGANLVQNMTGSLYQVNYVYMQPVIIFSILCGIWGIIMTMTMLAEVLKEHNIRSKFFVLQFVLLLAKFQGLLARFAITSELFPCKIPITPTVYANLIYNTSMLWEMMILGYIARKLYKQPVTDLSGGKGQAHICRVIPCPCNCLEKNNNQHINPVMKY